MSDEFDYGDDAGKGFEGFPPLTPWDCARILLGPIQLDMQVAAMRSLLSRNRTEDVRLRAQFADLERHAQEGTLRDFEIDHYYGELFYENVYQGGTHALAALGMVAPLTESVLVRLFQYVPLMGTPKPHPRRELLEPDRRKWNCKFRWDDVDRKWCDDIIGGVDQMAGVVDVERFLTRADRLRLRALFNYRNFMFHNGIEWPEEWAAKFEKLVAGWPDGWFRSARIGDKPWIFYMTESFTDECFEMLHRFVEGVGALFLEWSERTGQSFEELMPQ